MKIKHLLMTVGLAFGLACAAQAMDQRDYHQSVYDVGCDSCHDQGMGKFPSDQACLQCHDPDEVAEMTARKGEEQLQNPHDSMHYGKDAPCMDCHGEHTPKKALCQECHNFDYPKFK